MNFNIRLFRDEDLDAIVELSLLAWEPVYDSFEHDSGREGLSWGGKLSEIPPVLVARIRSYR